jgi:hypothetical protein
MNGFHRRPPSGATFSAVAILGALLVAALIDQDIRVILTLVGGIGACTAALFGSGAAVEAVFAFFRRVIFAAFRAFIDGPENTTSAGGRGIGWSFPVRIPVTARTLGLMMHLAARLMPQAARCRWLAEVASYLAECKPGQQRPAVRSYVRGAPMLILQAWARELRHPAHGIAGQPPQNRR